METLRVKGGKSLAGNVKISGAKNSVLPLIAAAALFDEECIFENVPRVTDVFKFIEILKKMGAKIEFTKDILKIDPAEIRSQGVVPKEASEFRASILIAGSLLGRFGSCQIPLPGGCAIGSRPIDQHLEVFTSLACDIYAENDCVEIKTENLTGNIIFFDSVSVGATENAILASVLASGKTTLVNSATEPEIIQLCEFLISSGAKIHGVGNATIHIEGVKKLYPPKLTRVIPDRIEAATYLCIAIACRANLIIENINPDHLVPIIHKLSTSGAKIQIENDTIRVNHEGKLVGFNVKTCIHPGFPTDAQPLFLATSLFLHGDSTIEENIFEKRFQHIPELRKMGGKISESGKLAVIKGGTMLRPSTVRASDLRAGAALLIVALGVSGTTKILDIHHLLRGYDDIINKLHSLGADVELVTE